MRHWEIENKVASQTETSHDQFAIKSKVLVERLQDRSCHLVATLEIEISRAKRYDRPLSMLSIASGSNQGAAAASAGFRQLSLEKRLRKIAPSILRTPDFWGRIDRLGFVIVLPETDAAGAEKTVQRMVATEPFQQMLAESNGRGVMSLGAAQLTDEIDSIDAFVKAAQANVVWCSEAEAAAASAASEPVADTPASDAPEETPANEPA